MHSGRHCLSHFHMHQNHLGAFQKCLSLGPTLHILNHNLWEWFQIYLYIFKIQSKNTNWGSISLTIPWGSRARLLSAGSELRHLWAKPHLCHSRDVPSEQITSTLWALVTSYLKWILHSTILIRSLQNLYHSSLHTKKSFEMVADVININTLKPWPGSFGTMVLAPSFKVHHLCHVPLSHTRAWEYRATAPQSKTSASADSETYLLSANRFKFPEKCKKSLTRNLRELLETDLL